MTEATISDPSLFERRVYREVSMTQGSTAAYKEETMRIERVRVPASAPLSIRVSLEIGQEDAGFWAHIDELDVSSEGTTADEAFASVVNAARAWLSYLRDEAPELDPEIIGQRAYVELLDAPLFSWFKAFELRSQPQLH